VSGRDSCVYWATGSGKSLCYQLPALHTGKTTFVVSPLISLMNDQVGIDGVLLHLRHHTSQLIAHVPVHIRMLRLHLSPISSLSPLCLLSPLYSLSSRCSLCSVPSTSYLSSLPRPAPAKAP